MLNYISKKPWLNKMLKNSELTEKQGLWLSENLSVSDSLTGMFAAEQNRSLKQLIIDKVKVYAGIMREKWLDTWTVEKYTQVKNKSK